MRCNALSVSSRWPSPTLHHRSFQSVYHSATRKQPFNPEANTPSSNDPLLLSRHLLGALDLNLGASEPVSTAICSIPDSHFLNLVLLTKVDPPPARTYARMCMSSACTCTRVVHVHALARVFMRAGTDTGDGSNGNNNENANANGQICRSDMQ